MHLSCSAALRAKLEEDRKERRRKLGLPEELTEEEKAREAEKARKKAEEEETKRHVYVKPISGEWLITCSFCRALLAAADFGWLLLDLQVVCTACSQVVPSIAVTAGICPTCADV